MSATRVKKEPVCHGGCCFSVAGPVCWNSLRTIWSHL